MKSSRRKFVGRLMAGSVATIGVPSVLQAIPKAGTIQTVLGPVREEDFGFALIHEHVMCDFAGAGATGRHRWEVDEVVRKMKPYLQQARQRGVRGFVDCTPACIGRDPLVLRQLAVETGLHLVTNTGYYGGAEDKFVPMHAYVQSAEQLARTWILEWERGIEGTGVRPGFVKTGVDEIAAGAKQLSEIDARLVSACALTSRRTGLTVVCHTGGGAAGLAAARQFIREGGEPRRFVVAHSDGHGLPVNLEAAGMGVWVSFDAVGQRPLEQHLKLVAGMIEKHADRLLLSMDSGWFWVEKPGGGEVRDYNDLTDKFLPALRKSGVTEEMVRRLTVTNPARALGSSPV